MLNVKYFYDAGAGGLNSIAVWTDISKIAEVLTVIG